MPGQRYLRFHITLTADSDLSQTQHEAQYGHALPCTQPIAELKNTQGLPWIGLAKAKKMYGFVLNKEYPENKATSMG